MIAGHLVDIEFRWPPGHQYVEFETSLEITIDPRIGSSYYWAKQFSIGESKAYAGLQTRGLIRGSEVPRMAIFSVWDGVKAEGASGACAEEFTEDGEGWSLRLPYDWKAGGIYTIRIYRAEDAQDGVWWAASVLDSAARIETLLGRIQLPGRCLAPEPVTYFFAEHFRDVGTCSEIALAEVVIHGVKGTHLLPDGRSGDSVAPQQACASHPSKCANAHAILADQRRVVVRTGADTERDGAGSPCLW